MTVSEPIALLSPCSLLSSVLTPWVNEAGFTPSHPRAVPSQCPSPGSQGSRHFHHKDREGSSPGERAWGPHEQSSSPPPGGRVPRGKTQSRSRVTASQLLSSHTGFPTRCCSLQAHSCFLSCHILGLPDGQTVSLECRSYFDHSLHNHSGGWRCGLRLRLSSCY